MISILMPAFNAARTIAQAIRSIQMQSFSDWELLVLDDASVDNTATIVRSLREPRVHLYCAEKNQGIVCRLNEGILRSRGQYIARMDADDIAFPERLERQYQFLETHSEISVVGSRIVIFDDSGQVLGMPDIPTDHSGLCARRWDAIPLPHPTWLAKKAWFAEHRYSSHAYLAEDQELLLRASYRSRFACLPDVLLGYRQNYVSWRKEALSRIGYVSGCIRGGSAGVSLATQCATVIAQSAKIGLASIAVTSGMKRVLLRRRFGRVSAPVVRRWREVWESVTAENV
jgi:glycosyltransferase involved in cell wall biosynthesis